MKQLLVVLLFLSSGLIAAQNPYGNTDVFSLEAQGDTINFLRISNDPSVQKPVLILCLGSFPAPLLIRDGENTIVPYMRVLFYEGLTDKFHLVLIGKPNTPAVMKREELSSQYTVVSDLSDPYSFLPEFSANNYLEKHVAHTIAVIEQVKKEKWADTDRILLMGHSQGAHIAAHVAYEYPEIAGLGYFGGNPLGRFAQFVVEERYRELKGELSMAAAQKRLEDRYEDWRVINRGLAPDRNGDPDLTWKSFGSNYVNKLAAVEVPVYVAYGTKDPGGHLCYLLPIYFELEGKTNYEMVPFLDRGHNYELFDEDGKPDMDTSKWEDAMKGFTEWAESFFQ